MTLQVITLGCSKNIVDTEHLLARLQGTFELLPEDHEGECDVLLINTCGFIGDAKEESIKVILEAVERKKRGEVGKLLVFGCLSQRYRAELPRLIPEVDGWYGARDLTPIVKALTGKCGPARLTDRVPVAPDAGYAYLKISEGCDRRCSYCAIPFIRGPYRSVPMDLLTEEARRLAARGIRELLLIAQDTTFYGMDLYRRRAIAELVERLSEIEGIEWIRLHYSYPAGFPETLLDCIADNPKVCKYMDLPLQHVSDRILKRMHRNVDGAWTRALIRKMRERIPGLVLRTTLIVGFPGEGPEEFEELLDFVRTAEFDRLGAFKYSEEEGTFGAEHFRDDVPEEVKQARYERLMEVQRAISRARNEARIGSVEEVMADAWADGLLVCRSRSESPEVDGEILVRPGNGLPEAQLRSRVGRFLRVRITGADDYDLMAEPYTE